MLKKCLVFVAAITVIGSGSPVQAFDWFGGRLSIGGGYGRAKPKLPYTYQDTYQDGEMWTGHIKYFLTNDFSVVASYADLEPYRRGDNRDIYRFRPIVGSLRYNLFRHLPFTPYITAGAGYSINKHEVPGAVATKWEGFTAQGGLGLEFFITEGTSLGAEAFYHHFEGDKTNINSPYRLISGVGTVNFYFGPGPSKRRAEEALEREKQEAERAKAEAEAAKAQALQAQQGLTAAQQEAAKAQQGMTEAQQAAATANASVAALQQQAQQAQAEMDKIKEMVASKQISPVTFKTGSAELNTSSTPTLDKVGEIAKKYPDLKLRVEGHTDSTGAADYNQTLSQERADSVRDYLTQEAGLSPEQVTPVGFGQSRPVAANATSEGRAQNRRVEFIFFLK